MQPPAKSMMSSPETLSFTEATRKRRTIRALQPLSPVSDSSIISLVEAAIHGVPSAFNSQSTRITILFKADHKKLWSIAATAVLAKIGDARFNSGTNDRIASLAKAYGTILFWDDSACVDKLKENAPEIYKDKIEDWMHQSNGMHQYYLWTALEAFGLGVNVQHYNPLIDGEVEKTWDVPSGWVLRAQMVFGTPEEGVKLVDKVQTLPMEKRLSVFGAGGDVAAGDSL